MNNKVSIWIGHISDNETLNDYIKERYTDQGDMSSLFMNSYHIDFIDNQFQEVLFLKENVTLQTLIAPLSYSEFFTHKLTLDTKDNFIIAVYNFEYTGEILNDEISRFSGVYEYTDG